MAKAPKKPHDGYDTCGDPEAEYVDDAPTILVNKRGIADLHMLQVAEEEALVSNLTIKAHFGHSEHQETDGEPMPAARGYTVRMPLGLGGLTAGPPEPMMPVAWKCGVSPPALTDCTRRERRKDKVMLTAEQLRQWAEHLDNHGVMPPTEVNPSLADELVKVLEGLLADYKKRVPMAEGFPEVAIATDILSRAAHQGPIRPAGR